MFMEQRLIESFVADNQGRELVKKTQTVYLFEGQTPNEKNMSAQTQNYYKQLFVKQETESINMGRPISIMELLFPLTGPAPKNSDSSDE